MPAKNKTPKAQPRDGFRRVTRTALLSSDDANDRWRRKKANGTAELLTRAQVEEEMEQKREEVRQKREARQDRRAQQRLERHEAGVRRKTARGRCANATKVLAYPYDSRLFVCSGTPKYGNQKRMDRKAVEDAHSAWGRCAKRNVVMLDNFGSLRYCVRRNGQSLRLSRRDLEEER